MRFADLDAITLDAYHTLVVLDEPERRLRDALREHGIHRTLDDVGAAFRAEVDYYSEHKHEGRDARSLAELRRACAQVFLDALGGGDGHSFAEAFASAIVLRPLAGALEALQAFRARGLALAVVSNWDCSLERQLAAVGIRVDAVVTCAGVQASKPDPRPLQAALERLGVAPSRALHIGDADADEEAAQRAGVRFDRFRSWR
jgi:FMN phosphatase YigB (HAD superfamily)